MTEGPPACTLVLASSIAEAEREKEIAVKQLCPFSVRVGREDCYPHPEDVDWRRQFAGSAYRSRFFAVGIPRRRLGGVHGRPGAHALEPEIP
jgi:hypothetical protein